MSLVIHDNVIIDICVTEGERDDDQVCPSAFPAKGTTQRKTTQKLPARTGNGE